VKEKKSAGKICAGTGFGKMRLIAFFCTFLRAARLENPESSGLCGGLFSARRMLYLAVFFAIKIRANSNRKIT
jgi:hypothetical protein